MHIPLNRLLVWNPQHVISFNLLKEDCNEAVVNEWLKKTTALAKQKRKIVTEKLCERNFGETSFTDNAKKEEEILVAQLKKRITDALERLGLEKEFSFTIYSQVIGGVTMDTVYLIIHILVWKN